jgi:hypothetical protein
MNPVFQAIFFGAAYCAAIMLFLRFGLQFLPGDGREAERLAKMAAEDAARQHPAE